MTNRPEPPAGGRAAPRLFDERARPGFREVYGGLARRSRYLDVALTSIRLSTLDLGSEELGRMASVRLLLAEVSSVSLDLEAHGVMLRDDKRQTLRLLTGLLSRGVIEVRSAPLGGWSPDFSIFREEADRPLAVLLGYHWFERPFPHRGPALAALHGADAARLALARFEQAWTRGHDIGPAILGILERAEREEPRSQAAQGVSGVAGPPAGS